MPPREQPDQHALDQPVLADDHALDLEHGAFELLGVVGGGARPGVGSAFQIRLRARECSRCHFTVHRV